MFDGFGADLFVGVYVVIVWFGSCWLLLIGCLLRRLVRRLVLGFGVLRGLSCCLC